MKVEQEFGLILGKRDAKKEFITEWCTKYVPAVILAIMCIIDDLDEQGM